MRGIRDASPRGVLGGPAAAQSPILNTALQYNFQRESVLTLPYPHNESKKEWVNSFTQLDLVLSPKQIITATLHISPQHINYVNPDFFNPQTVTPSYRQHNYVGTAADHWGIFGGILDSSLSLQRFNVNIGSQGDADMVMSPVGNRGNYFWRAGSNRKPHRVARNLVSRASPRRRNPPLPRWALLSPAPAMTGSSLIVR